jgi:CheY-like chemotaxis protein
MVNSATTGAAKPAPFSCGRVLIIDSQRALVHSTVSALSGAGYICTTVEPGLLVAQAARSMPWDVVIIGAHSNLVGGLTFLRSLRSMLNAPAVVVTTRPVADVPPAQVVALNIAAVVNEPINADTLLDAVAKAAATARASAAI